MAKNKRLLLKELRNLYNSEKHKIKSRLNEFIKDFNVGDENSIFAELVFCILTPQSKAKNCWKAVETLNAKNLLLKGSAYKIAKELKGVRFHNNKAKYIVAARNSFLKGNKINIKPKIKSFSNIYDAREWFVKNIKGLGYKEASHFLRNIGFGKKITILDRHILKNLTALGIIETTPTVLSKKVYFEIEDKMKNFSKKAKIPLDQLDILFWRKQTGEIFK